MVAAPLAAPSAAPTPQACTSLAAAHTEAPRLPPMAMRERWASMTEEDPLLMEAPAAASSWNGGRAGGSPSGSAVSSTTQPAYPASTPMQPALPHPPPGAAQIPASPAPMHAPAAPAPAAPPASPTTAGIPSSPSWGGSSPSALPQRSWVTLFAKEGGAGGRGRPGSGSFTESTSSAKQAAGERSRKDTIIDYLLFAARQVEQGRGNGGDAVADELPPELEKFSSHP